MTNIVLKSGTPRRMRRELVAHAKKGNHKVVIVGDRGSYAVAIRLPNTTRVVSNTFVRKTAAVDAAKALTGRNPITTTVKAVLKAA